MKCANCPQDATYTLADPGASRLDYCGACLPPHLRQRASLGQLALKEEAPKKTEAEAVKKKSKDLSKNRLPQAEVIVAEAIPAVEEPAPVVEEPAPVVEEPVVESAEEPVEESAEEPVEEEK